MSYTKQNFIKGQILKADHLNAMDAGIEANDIAINQLTEEIAEIKTGEKTITLVNLFDKSAVKIGYHLMDGTDNLATNHHIISDYIPVESGQTYSLMVSTLTHGVKSTPYRFIEAYNSSKQYIDKKTSPISYLSEILPDVSYRGDLIVTIKIVAADVKYIRFQIDEPTLDTLMMVKYEQYPDVYHAFGEKFTIHISGVDGLSETSRSEVAAMISATNPLYGKTVAFDGDSICNGSSAGDGKSGWAGRIGNKNAMVWQNYGIGGGTITSGTTTSAGENRHWISANIDTIYAERPELDYLILEGGTNDADNLGEEGIGSYNLDDMSGNYDASNFSGAMDTLLYKAVTYYPHAKIGFIIAHKMASSDHIRRKYFDRAVEICKKWGVPVIDLWYTSHLDRRLNAHFNSALDAAGNIAAGSLYTDGQHLTAQGYDVITPKIEAWMKML